MSLQHLVLLTALVVVGCGREPPQTPVSPTTTDPAPPSGQAYPRYQIVFSPHLRADTYLLDTQKGRVWQMTQFTDVPGQPSAWSETDIIDSNGEIGMTYSEFRKQYPASAEKVEKSKKEP